MEVQCTVLAHPRGTCLIKRSYLLLILYHQGHRKCRPIECARRHDKVAYSIPLLSVWMGRDIYPSTKTVPFIPSLRQVGSSGEKPRKEEGGRGCWFNRLYCTLTQHKSQRTCFLPISLTFCSLSCLSKSSNVSGPCISFLFSLLLSELIYPHYFPSMKATVLIWNNIKLSVLSVTG